MTEAELILTSVLNCRRIDLYVDKPTLTSQQQEQYHQILSRREKGEPLQYIIGFTDFMGLKLSVNPHVLIPRPETEILVDVVRQQVFGTPSNETVNILELGTGSGNIAVALATFIPEAKIVSVDISKEALEVACQNAKAHQADQRIEFIHQDMRDFLKQDSGRLFDIIVSNPPYIPTLQMSQLPVDVKQEPCLALDGGPEGLNFYKEIISRAFSFLKPKGFLFFEIGDRQRAGIEDIFKSCKQYQGLRFIQDYTTTDRIAVAQKRHGTTETAEKF